MKRRSVELVVISDVHLGTFGCHANELIQYLRSILPKTLVLNGDIIDIWQFSKRYFPQSHMQVIKEIFSLLSLGTRVVYITGNHDEIMRRYSDLTIGQLELTDKLILELDGKVTWIFHGDVFDRTTRGSAKVIAKLGGYGYDLLILLNRAINHVMSMLGKEKMSLSKQVKNGVKKAVSWINNFEQTAAELAIENKYDYVICGHIHQPQQREITTEKGSVTYLNSGDWIENLTSLEYEAGKWTIYHYDENEMPMLEKRTKVVPLSKVLSVENLVSQQIAFSATAKR
ncbi:MAG: UDP-2,3-diacylglucosamine diphosphatase [Chitinophagaceae bacterium]|jgi:UDP-2,3-diacylglucosamine pyrophosphatase LpxH|nr:UDP-2,3-diacylglucosamine diphosphatase [Chitinophagaceae bacterium]MCA6469923.1 UDP-2,3-diacylglucosamine diphosphatase [Chitinophagaceae bacterium]MCA6473293.1 UDP-2,3-diacylglucosamine diphosphatase [Chitinophagaceae bacterium]MCA6475222.1 UDP-2,3-diacylglucosamine diphosphatase [Chitinophagaceae bacterium]MCA6477628.1 UDP-2,3-diacylglucosamine diphosphatase [Chitinophagaceae bacterium]